MSGMRKKQREQAAQETRRTPVDFAQGRIPYTIHVRRRRNRRYCLAALVIILGVGAGIIAVLLAGWLTK